MTARYLITTAEQQTWKANRPILFLGEWCKSYSEREKWQYLDQETVSYHWDDREQLYLDYQYLTDFYERLLLSCSEALNKFHGTEHSVRYWRIVIGPWLGYFVQMAFDRWQMINKAIQEFKIDGTTVLDVKDEYVIPQDMTSFVKMFLGELWNHWIYKIILQETNAVPVSIKKYKVKEEDQQRIKKNTISTIKTWVKLLIRKSSFLLAKRNNYFFISSSLGRKQLQLEFLLGQFPGLWHSPDLLEVKINYKQRLNLSLTESGKNKFESFLCELLFKQIPVAYLEGYRQIVHQIEKIDWPSNPKVIFTGNAHNSNDFFKLWAAEKIEAGAKLVISQHGGHYGIGKWNFNEEHEIAIADRYFSWGWKKANAPLVIPMPAGKLSQAIKLKCEPQGGLLMVLASGPQYSYWMYSIPVSAQFNGYWEDQFNFVKTLSSDAFNNLLVRLYPQDFGWAQKERWKDRFKNVQFDSLEQSMYKSITQSRLVVGTYNATTFLETFGANVPTVIFWNPDHWELRPAAQPYFDKLRQVGIFHDTPESAAAKVNEIFSDTISWWNDPDIQKAKDEFCDEFAYFNDGWLREWKEELRSIT